MKSLFFSVATLGLLTSFVFLQTGPKDKTPYVVPTDKRQAAAFINKAFASTFKPIEYAVKAEDIKTLDRKGFVGLLKTTKDIPDSHRSRIMKDIKDWRELRATVFTTAGEDYCAGKDFYTAIIEGGGAGNATGRRLIYSTCGVFRCILNGVSHLDAYRCAPASPITTVRLCSDNPKLCCVTAYCNERSCPTEQCKDHGDCSSCQ